MNLTLRQAKFVDEFVVCGNAAAAARRAGYRERSARQIGYENLTKPYIQAALAAKEAEIANKIELKQDHVIAGIFEAIGAARSQGDPGNVIRGWCEVAKITGLGHPAEVKRVLGAEGARLRQKFEALSTEQLLEIAAGRG